MPRSLLSRPGRSPLVRSHVGSSWSIPRQEIRRLDMPRVETRSYIQSPGTYPLSRRVLHDGEPRRGTAWCDVTAATRAARRLKEVRAPRARRESSTIGLIERIECAHCERLRVMEEVLREYRSKTISHPVRWHCGDPISPLDRRPGARRDTFGQPGCGPTNHVRSGPGERPVQAGLHAGFS